MNRFAGRSNTSLHHRIALLVAIACSPWLGNCHSDSQLPADALSPQGSANDASVRPLTGRPGNLPTAAQVFPGVEMMVPDGETFVERDVPNTVDLADIAKNYIQGMTQSLLPSNNYAIPGFIRLYQNKASAGGSTSSPFVGEFDFKGGAQNQGKILQALVRARRMSGYDLNNSENTLAVQLEAFRTTLDETRQTEFAYTGQGTPYFSPSFDARWGMSLTPSTVVAEGLIELYRDKPNEDLKTNIQFLVDLHTAPKHLREIKDPSEPDRTFFHLFHFDKRNLTPLEYQQNVLSNYGSFIGMMGDFYTLFINGTASRMLSDWAIVSQDQTSFLSSQKLNEFLLRYDRSAFWDTERFFTETLVPLYTAQAASDPALKDILNQALSQAVENGMKIPGGPGRFMGHDHSYANALMGILAEADFLVRKDRQEARGLGLLRFSRDAFIFARDYHGLGVLGNFGESCMVGDMMRLAVRLSKIARTAGLTDASYYTYDDVSVREWT
jgi:hypothetical protein